MRIWQCILTQTSFFPKQNETEKRSAWYAVVEVIVRRKFIFMIYELVVIVALATYINFSFVVVVWFLVFNIFIYD